MAQVVESRKACAVNPLKMSQPLGASFAFMGLDACMPVMHGSQGCTSFGLVLLVRHFKEAIPLQTTAMNEVTTILGGYENLETALVNIHQRAAPKVIAICSTGLTETRGDDVAGDLKLVRQRRPELADTALVYVSTPDYVGAFEDGYRRALVAIVDALVQPQPTQANLVTLVPGSHLSPGDIDELRDIIDAYGLRAIVLPDVSGSLDGHIAPDWRGTTLGGTTLEELRAAGGSAFTLGVGEQTRAACAALSAIARTPHEVFARLTGLACNDRLHQRLAAISGRPVPARYRRQRSQLLDAMLDGHFYTGGVKVAIGAEPDLLLAVGSLLHEMGAELAVCVSTTQSPAHALLPAETVLIGDLEDMERAAEKAGCDLLVTHAHGRQMAARLGKPLMRIGFPVFDRVGNAHRVQVGYRGTMNLIFEVANLMIEQIAHHHAHDWPLTQEAARAAASEAGRAAASVGAMTGTVTSAAADCGAACGCGDGASGGSDESKSVGANAACPFTPEVRRAVTSASAMVSAAADCGAACGCGDGVSGGSDESKGTGANKAWPFMPEAGRAAASAGTMTSAAADCGTACGCGGGVSGGSDESKGTGANVVWPFTPEAGRAAVSAGTMTSAAADCGTACGCGGGVSGGSDESKDAGANVVWPFTPEAGRATAPIDAMTGTMTSAATGAEADCGCGDGASGGKDESKDAGTNAACPFTPEAGCAAASAGTMTSAAADCGAACGCGDGASSGSDESKGTGANVVWPFTPEAGRATAPIGAMTSAVTGTEADCGCGDGASGGKDENKNAGANAACPFTPEAGCAAAPASAMTSAVTGAEADCGCGDGASGGRDESKNAGTNAARPFTPEAGRATAPASAMTSAVTGAEADCGCGDGASGGRDESKNAGTNVACPFTPEAGCAAAPAGAMTSAAADCDTACGWGDGINRGSDESKDASEDESRLLAPEAGWATASANAATDCGVACGCAGSADDEGESKGMDWPLPPATGQAAVLAASTVTDEGADRRDAALRANPRADARGADRHAARLETRHAPEAALSDTADMSDISTYSPEYS